MQPRPDAVALGMLDEPEETEKLPNFAGYWERLKREADLVEAPVRDTIRHDADVEAQQFATLPVIALTSVGAQPALFEMSDERLGLGGVGEVRLAKQPALQRDVAVKVARGGAATMSHPSRMLLREALVMGYLEHPNIVPVHVVGCDDAGELVVAMKRIQGITLADSIRREGPGGALDHHLDILVAVCHAVDFAHRRGVLHLDIKPANVMIGPFGDVYLVDWGAAVAYRDDVPDTIPRPLADGKIRGTPAFLPPETVTQEASTPQTDVYLLGGLLHMMLTGEPPNRGDTLEEALRSSYQGGLRSFPEKVPAELGRIANRALSREPDGRYRTASEMREEIERYRTARAAFDLHASARARVANFVSMLADGSADAEVYAAFGVARQLLSEASRLYDERAAVVADEQGLLVAMIDWELEKDNPVAALQLARELPVPDEELFRRVERAVKARESELDELKSLRREMDPGVANTTKVIMFVVIGSIIGSIHLIPELLGIESTTRGMLVGHVVYLLALAGVTWMMRGRMFATFANRQIIELVWLMSLFGLLLRSAAVLGWFALDVAVCLDLALVALVAAFGATTLDKRLWPAPIVYAGAAVLAGSLGGFGAVAFGLGHFVALSAVAASFALREPNTGTAE